MKLYIMRHGQAEAFAESDRDRPLSDVGRWQVTEVARKMCGSSLTGILASPYLRTLQTAELMQAEVAAGVQITCCEHLTPDSPVHAALRELPDSGNWLLVSHMPLVSRLVGLLTEDAPDRGIVFSPSMVVELEMSLAAPGLAEQVVLYTP